MPPELSQAVFVAQGKKHQLVQTNPAYAFYGAMRLFFQNGGGACYVVSIGSYEDAFDAEAMLRAITRLKKEPEPTMLVIPETTRLSRVNAVKVQQAMLTHCGTDMKNRIAILDISGGYLPLNSARGHPADVFREDIGINDLNFSAAYYPWLNTSIYQSRDFSFENIALESRGAFVTLLTASVNTDAAFKSEIVRVDTPELTGDFTINVPVDGTALLDVSDFSVRDDGSGTAELRYEVLDGGQMAGALVEIGKTDVLLGFTQADLKAGKVSYRHDKNAGTAGQFDIIATYKDGVATAARTVFVVAGDVAVGVPDIAGEIAQDDAAAQARAVAADKLMLTAVSLYSNVMDAITAYMNAMPPAAATAGMYAAVDSNRGVWKALANVSLNAVTSPMVNINHDQQENLNVSTTGMSINAIRPFVGEGTLVWGARTLDGNSLD